MISSQNTNKAIRFEVMTTAIHVRALQEFSDLFKRLDEFPAGYEPINLAEALEPMLQGIDQGMNNIEFVTREPLSDSAPDEFTRIFMAYGGGDAFVRVSEQRRLGFCNWLLLECLEEYPRREQFIKAFSAGGTKAHRVREARFLATYPHITVGDLVDAALQSCTDPEALVNYAGDDGCK